MARHCSAIQSAPGLQAQGFWYVRIAYSVPAPDLMVAAIFLALLCVASALLAWIDLRRGIIPDWLNL